MKKIEQAVILKNQCYIDNIYDMVLYAPEIANVAKAGQFINVYTGKAETILPRPISISEIDKKEGTLRLLYQVIGKGTEHICKLQKGSSIKILGALGNGFFINEKHRNHILIGGGIGVPPMLELAKTLQGNIHIFIGAKSKPILVEEFQKIGANISIATDDGSQGICGTVLDAIEIEEPTADMIYACGPKVMLKAVSEWAEKKQMQIQVSMEERMACGIGACVGCAIKINKKGTHDWENLKVCKDGPVFWGNEVVWND